MGDHGLAGGEPELRGDQEEGFSHLRKKGRKANHSFARSNRNLLDIERPQEFVPDRPAVASALNSLHADSLSVPGTLAMLAALNNTAIIEEKIYGSHTLYPPL